MANKHFSNELFEEIFDTHCFGCYRVCSCGREYFDTSDNQWTWEEGELENLIKNSEKYPDRYFPTDGAVGTVNINGTEIVQGCKCLLYNDFKSFLNNHKKQIIEYYRKCAEHEVKENQEILDLLENSKIEEK